MDLFNAARAGTGRRERGAPSAAVNAIPAERIFSFAWIRLNTSKHKVNKKFEAENTGASGNFKWNLLQSGAKVVDTSAASNLRG